MSTQFPTFQSWYRTAAERSRAFGGWLLMLPPFRGLLLDPHLLLRELAATMRSGLPLPQAVASLMADQPRIIRRHLEALSERLAAGEPLSEAIDALPRSWYPSNLGAMIAAAERAGTVPQLLEELSQELMSLSSLERRLSMTLVYPMVVLAFAGVILTVVISKVMPVMSAMYVGLGEESLPRVSAFLVDVIGPWMSVVVWICFGIALVLVWGLRGPSRYGAIGSRLRAVARRLPIGRGLYAGAVELRFSRLLRLLLEGGIPLPEALDLCRTAIDDRRAGRAIVEAADRIRAGDPPSDALRGLGFLSPSFLWFLEGSEARGDFLELTRMMCETAQERLELRIDGTRRVMEPMVVVALGIVVGSIVIGCYQPMFNLIRLVGAG
jgi:general secretion pathway protein F